MKIQVKHFIVSVITLLFCSCNSDDHQSPKGVLSEREMIEVLTEIELTQALIKLKSTTQDTINHQHLFNAIYTAFNTTEVEFNNSLNYYCKDPKLLMNMYVEVIENLTKKQSEQQKK